MRQLLGIWATHHPDVTPDYDLLQVAGSTYDYGQLPHHVSTPSDINSLFEAFSTFLRGQLHSSPLIVTMSRYVDVGKGFFLLVY